MRDQHFGRRSNISFPDMPVDQLMFCIGLGNQIRVPAQPVAQRRHPGRDGLVRLVKVAVFGAVDQGLMIGGVQFQMRGRVICRTSLGHTFFNCVQIALQSLGVVTGGEPQRAGFKNDAHIAQRRQFLRGGGENECAALWFRPDEAFNLQPRERFAYGRPADGQTVCDRRFGQSGAKIQRPGHDFLAQVVSDKIGKRSWAFKTGHDRA